MADKLRDKSQNKKKHDNFDVDDDDDDKDENGGDGKDSVMAKPLQLFESKYFISYSCTFLPSWKREKDLGTMSFLYKARIRKYLMTQAILETVI